MNNVYITCNGSAISHRNEKRSNRFTEFFFQTVNNCSEINVFFIYFINKDNFRDFIFVSKLPCFFCTNLNSCFTAYHNNYTVGSGNAFNHFSLEIKKTGSIYNINLTVIPLYIGNRCINRNFSFCLLGIKVHNGISVRNLSLSVNGFCFVQNSFRKVGFTRTSMSNKGNVPYVGCFEFFHRKSFLSVFYVINVMLHTSEIV